MANVTITSKTSARIRVFAGTIDGKKSFFTKTVKFDPKMKEKERDTFLDAEAKKFEVSCIGRTIITILNANTFISDKLYVPLIAENSFWFPCVGEETGFRLIFLDKEALSVKI